jgi:hypothetical protein
MNRLNQVGVAREGLQRSRLGGPEELGDVVLLPLPRGELAPRQRVLPVAPAPRHGIQLWAIGWEAHQAPVGREGKVLGGVGPAVIQEQEIPAVREGVGEGMQEDLEAVCLERGQLQEAPVARRRLYGTIDSQPLEPRLHRAHWLHATRGEAAAADGQQADTAFVLAKDPDGAGVRRGDRPLEVCLAGALEGRDGLRLFGCDWGAALCAWLESASARACPAFCM